jgi:hypothetical protein
LSIIAFLTLSFIGKLPWQIISYITYEYGN